tara:strand:+ start:1086 stop:1331 length:246 start_codon:yes stop_codon:yes gene_type:complete
MSLPQCSHIGGTNGFTNMGVTSAHSVQTVTSWQIVIQSQLNCYYSLPLGEKTPYMNFQKILFGVHEIVFGLFHHYHIDIGF